MKNIKVIVALLGFAILQTAAMAQDSWRVSPPPRAERESALPGVPIFAMKPRESSNIRGTSEIAPAPIPISIPVGEPVRMTLDELQQIALANNPTIGQAVARIRALQGKQVQAGLYPNPILGYIGDEMGNECTAGQQGGFLKQEVVTNGKRGLSRATIGHEVAQAEYALQIQRWRVMNDVRAGAYEVAIAQRTIDLEKQLVQIGETGVKIAEKMLTAKEVSRVDVLQARVEFNSARLQLDNAFNQYSAAWKKLAILVGSPDMESKPLADDLDQNPPPLDWNDSVSKLLSGSPELAQARAGVDRARCDLARQCAERIPNVDLEGGLRYNNASSDSVAMIQVGVPLQIFNRNQGNIAKAQSELSAASAEVRRVELDLQSRLADAYRSYINADQQIRRYTEEILPDAKQSLDLVKAGYEHGEFSYLELLTAQRTYFRVNLSYVESLRDLWIGRTRIEGMLLSGGLQN
jgi:cobalt-zinc-cadmium efflux system outer membrane protein